MSQDLFSRSKIYLLTFRDFQSMYLRWWPCIKSPMIYDRQLATHVLCTIFLTHEPTCAGSNWVWITTYIPHHLWNVFVLLTYGPLARCLKLRVAHVPGTFSPPLRDSDPDMHHGKCVTHLPRCMSGSLTRGFLWNLWWGKRSPHPRCMCNPYFTYLVRGLCIRDLNRVSIGNKR